MITFKEYKDNIFFKNIEEIVINKEINIRGKEVLILSLIKEQDSNQLWTVHKRTPYTPQYENIFDIKTNREEYRSRVISSSHDEHICFRNMKIQGNEINFTSSESSSIEYAHGNQVNIIKHFVESGLLTDKWDDVDIEHIIFGIYKQDENEEFPQINFNEKINIVLNIDEHSQEVLIEQPLKVKIGEEKEDTRIYYKNNKGEEEFFYLDGIVKYDLHKDTLEKLKENIEYIEEDERQNHIDTMMDDISRICPKDKDIASIYYETKDNSQLVFYTKEKLEAKPVYNTSCTGMLWCSDEKYGINGFYKYVDMLCPVEKEFDGELEIELFSKYNKIPSEEIKFEI